MKNINISNGLKRYYSENPDKKPFNGKKGTVNREKISKSLKLYYEKHTSALSLNRTDHEKKMINREKVHRSRAKKKGLSVESEIDQIKLFYMNCPEGYEVDHIISFAKQGKHSIYNLQYLTPGQNRKKGTS